MKANKADGATRQRRDQAFKQEAVRLWESSGRAAEKIAQELGVKAHDLYRWKRAGQWGRRL